MEKINNATICKQRDLLYEISNICNRELELLEFARLGNAWESMRYSVNETLHNDTVWCQLQFANFWLYTTSCKETLYILCKEKPH
jgi:hypothetical protein